MNLARRVVPRRLRYGVQRFISLDELKQRWRLSKTPEGAVLHGDEDQFGGRIRLGILANRALFHVNYVRACQEIGVPFAVIDLQAENWLEQVCSGGFSAFLVWPDATRSWWSQLFKDRCRLIESELGLRVYPDSGECWPYENKYRMRDWLMASGMPHPRTWVFVDREPAIEFARACELPIVFKTAFGAAASGVQILRSRRAVLRTVRRCFGRGYAPAGHDFRDRDWGRVFLQEYIPDAIEWRLVRIGSSWFGHPKGRVGEFHSGSGVAEWSVPEPRHLALLEQVTERGGFRSMAVDVFETVDGRLLVNELQTVFGASTSIDQMRMNGQPGRFIRDESGQWLFEPGDHARNACANARVLDLLHLMGVSECH